MAGRILLIRDLVEVNKGATPDQIRGPKLCPHLVVAVLD